MRSKGFVPFYALGESDIVLRGPFDSTEVRYTPPLSWVSQDGAYLVLSINTACPSLNATDLESSGCAALEVTLNDMGAFH